MSVIHRRATCARGWYRNVASDIILLERERERGGEIEEEKRQRGEIERSHEKESERDIGRRERDREGKERRRYRR